MWIKGWTLSRGLTAPVRVDGGFRVNDIRPDRKARYVLPRLDPQVLRQIPAEPATWLTVFAETTAVMPLLSDAWSPMDECHLMAAKLTRQLADPPPGYSIDLATTGAVTRVRVLDRNGDEAAHGQYARTGRHAIIDQVETEPAHQRRGLGRTVMRVLSTHAAVSGQTHGVLAATDQGHALYTALGWQRLAPMAMALVPAA
jgi:GNAT superfamily N-acetyltransferase